MLMAGVQFEQDRISKLLALPFSTLTYSEKLNIVKGGRPTPALPLLVQTGKSFQRHFQSSNYDRYRWLAGSSQANLLYCWDCLLFTVKNKGPWAKDGFNNLNCLTKAAIRHQNTSAHVRATVSLKTFGETFIDMQSSDQHHRENLANKEKVRQNREILKRLIHSVVFLAKQELPIRGHDSVDSENKGNYLELLDFLGEYDSALRCHLATSNVFTGSSSKIHNLIDSVANVMVDAMQEQVKKTPFVAIMVDDTTDVSNAAQMSYVLRYITEDGVKERFFRFDNFTGEKRAETIASRVLCFLEEFGCTEKVVAQCYDGTAAMPSGLNGIQATVKETIPQALFIHGYAHTLNLVMSQGAAKMRECSIFFAHLSGMASFFWRSPECATLLDEIYQRKLSKVSPSRWSCSSHLVCTVFENREGLEELFENIVDNHEDFDQDTIHSADGYLTNLGSFEFCFLLFTFNSIFAHSDILFGILQSNELDVQFSLDRIDEFCSTVERERQNFESVYDETVRQACQPTGRRSQAPRDTKAWYQQLHSKIINHILTQIRDRFKDHERLIFLALLDQQQFHAYRHSFPNTAFANLEESYGPHFDLPRLKVELGVIYAMADFEGRSPADLLNFLQQMGLTESLHQVYLLTCLVLTVPVSTASVERTFSALKRIKTYTRNTTGQGRVSAVALISIEKGLLSDLKSKDIFYDSTITHFMEKEKRMPNNVKTEQDPSDLPLWNITNQ